MKQILVGIIFFFGLLIIIPQNLSAHTITGSVTTLHMTENGYTPQNITIRVGDTVAFENVGKENLWPASNIHPSHEIYPDFDPKKMVKPGETWSFTFLQPGVWRYHDHLFPEVTGAITVIGDPKAKTPLSFVTLLKNIVYGFASRSGLPVERKTYSHIADMSITEDNTSINTDEKALFSYVKKYGPKKAVVHLAAVDHAQGRDCHQAAHTLGKFAYEIHGEKAFATCSAECHSGCYHGATEAFFREHGTDDLKKNLTIICNGAKNAFFLHQCFHGVGHGLMAWTDYEIHTALKQCDVLEQLLDSCYTGVFMENIVGGIALREGTEIPDRKEQHYTKYLNNDPQFPCSIVGKRYRGSCYFYQSTRMAQLYNYDFEKVSAACLGAPAEYQRLCIDSMGRDIAGNTGNDPQRSIALCQYAPSGILRAACMRGAVQNAFWDPTGQDTSLSFCRLLTDTGEKATCYVTIFERASQLLPTKEAKENFCKKTESEYTSQCRSTLQV